MAKQRMDLPYRSLARALGACLLLGCLLPACGSDLPAAPPPPQVPSGPGPRVTPVGSGGVSAPAAVGGTTMSSGPAPGQLGTGMSAVGGDPLGLDAGVEPIAGMVASAGRGGAGGRAGAGGAGGRGAAGVGGAAGATAADETCRDVFCFTPLECLFFTVPCGFSDCVNFSCR